MRNCEQKAADAGADGGSNEIKHRIVNADGNELLHALPEEFVAEELEKLPHHRNRHRTKHNKTGFEDGWGLVDLVVDHHVMADECREDARAEMNEFIEERRECVEVHANAHVERDEYEDIIDELDAESEFTLKDCADDFWEKWQK